MSASKFASFYIACIALITITFLCSTGQNEDWHDHFWRAALDSLMEYGSDGFDEFDFFVNFSDLNLLTNTLPYSEKADDKCQGSADEALPLLLVYFEEVKARRKNPLDKHRHYDFVLKSILRNIDGNLSKATILTTAALSDLQNRTVIKKQKKSCELLLYRMYFKQKTIPSASKEIYPPSQPVS